MVLGYLCNRYIVCLCTDKCDPGVGTIVLELLFERLAKEGFCSPIIDSIVDGADDSESF
jgi:hypothetical protein